MKKLDKSFSKHSLILYGICSAVFLAVIGAAIWLQSQQSVSISISNNMDTTQISTTTEFTYARLTIILAFGLIISLIITYLVQRIQKNRIIFEIQSIAAEVQNKDVGVIQKNYSYEEFEIIKQAYNEKILSINEMASKREEYFNMTVHDLRTPIQVVKNNANLLEKYPHDKELLAGLKEEIIHLENEVTHYLILEKIEYFEKPKLVQVDINEMVDRLINKYGLEANVSLVKSKLNCIQNVDLQMFEKVIMNLIQNGLQYSPDMHVWVIVGEESLLFENTTEEYVSNIFCEERKRSKNGNGLGTLIIQKYAKLQGLGLEENNTVNKVRVKVRFI